jgi:uncharacterized protein (TIGR03435 family)
MNIFAVCSLSIHIVFLPAVFSVETAISSKTGIDHHPAFEVASIKPVQPGSIPAANTKSGRMNPGVSIDGDRVNCFMPLKFLVTTAYHLKTFQISGPDWLESQRFEIHAKLPAGSTKDEVPEMIKSLLKDRFKMVVHWEKSNQPVYALVVIKGGPKLKKATDADAPSASSGSNESVNSGENASNSYNKTDGQQMTIKREGQTIVKTGGREGTVRTNVSADGIMHMELPKITMDAFAEETLAEMIRERPVVNQTHLKGPFQVTMEFPYMMYIQDIVRNAPLNTGLSSIASPFGEFSNAVHATDAGMAASDPSNGVIFRAVQKLGLKLQSQKAVVQRLIIDHIEKNPTEN